MARRMIVVAASIIVVTAFLPISLLILARPYMRAELGAIRAEIRWPVTNYLIAAAAVMPLSGHLADRFGAKQLRLGATAFTVASVMCGLAGQLATFIALRFLQAATGAPLVTVTQPILIDTHPPQERASAIATWSLSSTGVPIFGPTIGAWFTDHMIWRWCFHLSVPMAIVGVPLALQVIARFGARSRRMDWVGFGLFACAIGGLQFDLDRGNRLDWFESVPV